MTRIWFQPHSANKKCQYSPNNPQYTWDYCQHPQYAPRSIKSHLHLFTIRWENPLLYFTCPGVFWGDSRIARAWVSGFGRLGRDIKRKSSNYPPSTIPLDIRTKDIVRWYDLIVWRYVFVYLRILILCYSLYQL